MRGGYGAGIGRASRGGGLGLLFLGVLVMAACKGGATAPKGTTGSGASPGSTSRRISVDLSKVVVRVPSSLGIRTITKKTVRSKVAQALQGAPFAGAEGGKRYRLRVEVAAGFRRTAEGKKEFVAIVTFRAVAPTVAAGALEASVVAPLRRAGVAVEDSDAALRERHVWRTFASALGAFRYQAKLTAAPGREVVAALQDKDVDHVITAIEICAARKIPGAVSPLIALLGRKDRRITDRVIGALVTLGDRRAVKPLTRLVKFGDSPRMAQVIDGIGSLGGAEARAFLEFVADGHASPNIRDLARGALARMDRHGVAR